MGAVDDPSLRPKPTSRDTARVSSGQPTSFFLTTDPTPRSIDEKERDATKQYPVLEELKKRRTSDVSPGRSPKESEEASEVDEKEGEQREELRQSTDFGVQSLAAGLEISGPPSSPTAEGAEHEIDTVLGRRSTITDLKYVPSSLMPSLSPSPQRIPRRGVGEEMHMQWSVTSLEGLSEGPGSPVSTRHSHSDEEGLLSEAESLPFQTQSLDQSPHQSHYVRPAQVTDSQITEQTASVQLVMPSLLMPHRRSFTARGQRLRKLRVVIAGGANTGKTTLLKSILKECLDIVHIDTSSPLEESLANIGRVKNTKRPSYREVAASTRVYPTWRDEGKRRRKDKEVLCRNVHFTDMVGEEVADGGFRPEKTSVVQYVKAQMDRACDFEAMRESEVLGLLSGEGGTMVDVVLYCIRDATETDKKLVRLLSEMTNVIPVLHLPHNTDLSSSNLTSQVSRIQESLKDSHLATLPSSTSPSAIYAVQTSPSISLEAMDASLLMSSTSPLPNSSLTILITDLFDHDNASYLEYTAAKKLLNYRAVRARHVHVQSPQTQRGRTIRRSPLAAIDDGKGLSGWAERFRESQAPVMATSAKTRYGYGYVSSDPLGISTLIDTFSMHSWTALKLVGSFGVLGAMALWLSRVRGGDLAGTWWGGDW